MRTWVVLLAGVLWVGGVRSAPPETTTDLPDLRTDAGYASALDDVESYWSRDVAWRWHSARRERDQLLPVLVYYINNDQRKLALVACAATYVLGYLGHDAPVDLLRNLMRDRRPWLQCAAMGAAGESGNHAFVADLMGFVPASNVDVACCAAGALGALGAEVAVPTLSRTLGETTAPKVARSCIMALGRIGSPAGQEPIMAYMAAHPGDTEAAAMGKEALDLIRLLTGPDRAQRLAALACPANEAPTPLERIWSITQIARLRLTELTATLRASLDRRRAYVASQWPQTKGQLEADYTAFELAKALYKLGGQLRADELKVLKEEHLIAADGAPRW